MELLINQLLSPRAAGTESAVSHVEMASTNFTSRDMIQNA